jgi:NADH-quinone oxidoreductase subunit N
MDEEDIQTMNFTLILPEIALAALAILLVALDLALPEGRKRVLAYVGAAGLIVPAALVASMAGRQEVSFAGTYVVDNLSTFFKVVFLLAAALVLLSGSGYVEKRSKHPGEFYALVLFSTLGMLFMASARELVTVYVALELTSIMLYILAGYLKDNLGSTEAGLKYLLLGALSSAVLLYGIALLYGASGTTVLPDIAARIQPNALAIVASIMIAAGFGFKVAMVPFHLWVPDVYQGAPTPATAFISVASKAAGFVVLLRVFQVALAPLDGVWPSMFAVLAAITMTVGNVGALRQTNVKRIMGYSSIGQAGYALMGLATASAQTSSALVFFIFAYALTNLGVFAAITHVSDRLDSDEVEAYNGLSQRAPVLALAMTLCLLSLVGMPPLAGFWSKVNLFYNVFSQGQVALVLIALLNAAVGAYYYLKIVHAVYLKPAPIDKPLPGSFSVSLALAVAVAAVLVVGLVPDPFIGFATAAAAAVHP